RRDGRGQGRGEEGQWRQGRAVVAGEGEAGAAGDVLGFRPGRVAIGVGRGRPECRLSLTRGNEHEARKPGAAERSEEGRRREGGHQEARRQADPDTEAETDAERTAEAEGETRRDTGRAQRRARRYGRTHGAAASQSVWHRAQATRRAYLSAGRKGRF